MADTEVQPHQDFINLAKFFLCPCALMCQKIERPTPYTGPPTFLLRAPSHAPAFGTGSNLTACFSHTLLKAPILTLFCSLTALGLVSFSSLRIYIHGKISPGINYLATSKARTKDFLSPFYRFLLSIYFFQTMYPLLLRNIENFWKIQKYLEFD